MNTLELWCLLGTLLLSIGGMLGKHRFILSGLSAFMVGIATMYNMCDLQQWYIQLIFFALIFGLLSLLLSRPIAYLKQSAKDTNLNDVIGSIATVFDNTIEAGKIGKIKYSGAILNAQLFHNEDNTAKKGEKVKIMNVKGNIFFIKRLN